MQIRPDSTGPADLANFFFNLQLWTLIFLQPFDQNECLVPHLKHPIHICLEPENQGHGMTFSCSFNGSKYPQNTTWNADRPRIIVPSYMLLKARSVLTLKIFSLIVTNCATIPQSSLPQREYWYAKRVIHKYDVQFFGMAFNLPMYPSNINFHFYCMMSNFLVNLFTIFRSPWLTYQSYLIKFIFLRLYYGIFTWDGY